MTTHSSIMKIRNSLILFLVLTAFLIGGVPCRLKEAEGVSLSFFYDSLEPYGEWFEVPNYGYCWRPTGVDPEWVPYSDGYWVYTDAGWTWVSYEEWGGITYHYGRWTRLYDMGWCWVPGYDWGPAWVSWRSSDHYIGWAPLPPDVVFSNETGISAEATYGIGPDCYNFCRFSDFGSPALRSCILPRGQNIGIIINTTNSTKITVHTLKHFIMNGGPDLDFVQGKSTRPIQTLKLVRLSYSISNNSNRNSFFVKQHGNQLDVVVPIVHPPGNGEKPRPRNVGVASSMTGEDRGWNRVSEAQMKQLKYQPQSLNQPPIPGHSKPIGEIDFRIIPEHPKTPTPTVGKVSISPSPVRHSQITVTPFPSVPSVPLGIEIQRRHSQLKVSPIPSVTIVPLRSGTEGLHPQVTVPPVPTVPRPPARDEIISTPRRAQPSIAPDHSERSNHLRNPNEESDSPIQRSRPSIPAHSSENNRHLPSGRHEAKPTVTGTGVKD